MPLRTSSSLTLWWIGKQRAFVDGLSKVFGTSLACHKEEETMTKNSPCSGIDWGHNPDRAFAEDGKRICLTVGSRSQG